ncbi:hypothetical protein [Streptomyces sp. NPDC000961]
MTGADGAAGAEAAGVLAASVLVPPQPLPLLRVSGAPGVDWA